jgi:hypothetical protein
MGSGFSMGIKVNIPSEKCLILREWKEIEQSRFHKLIDHVSIEITIETEKNMEIKFVSMMKIVIVIACYQKSREKMLKGTAISNLISWMKESYWT